MGAYAKAYEAVSSLARRWTGYRVNRRLDDRDFVLRDALQILERRSSGIYPTILKISAALALLSVGAGAQTGLTVTGVNFIGDMVKATGKSSEGIANTEITWTAVRPGDQTISLVFVHTGALSVASVTATTITVNINAGTTTATQIVAAIAAHATAKFKIVGVASGTGAGTPAAQTTSITDGKGTVPTMSIGSVAIDDSAGFGITSYTDTVITFNFDSSALTASERLNLILTVDDVRVEPMPINVVA